MTRLSEFRCLRCGTCCKWEGPVRGNEEEIGSCVYYDDAAKSCRINPVKPHQCSAFPFEWNFPGWDDLCAGGKALKLAGSTAGSIEKS